MPRIAGQKTRELRLAERVGLHVAGRLRVRLRVLLEGGQGWSDGFDRQSTRPVKARSCPRGRLPGGEPTDFVALLDMGQPDDPAPTCYL
jgi:hypothetical protein